MIANHKLRSNGPLPELDLTINFETETSQQLQFEAYNVYEFDDFGLSRLVVKLLLSPTFMDKIVTKFGNDPEFEIYPGQVLFMMDLDACNASVQRDVAGFQVKYDELTLDAYPGEDMTKLGTEVLHLIHILQ